MDSYEKRKMQRAENKRKREAAERRKRLIVYGGIGVLAVICLVLLVITRKPGGTRQASVSSEVEQLLTQGVQMQVPDPELDVQLLTVNEFSRPAFAMEEINGIVIHYTANPRSSAQDNRNYFESLKDEQTTKVSSHFVIGLDGEIIQCIPSSEISYASNSRNDDTLSIELCHPDESGEFTDATYTSLVQLVAWLCLKFDVPLEGIIRHGDVIEKNCPKYFMENPDKWQEFKEDVQKYIDENASVVENES